MTKMPKASVVAIDRARAQKAIASLKPVLARLPKDNLTLKLNADRVKMLAAEIPADTKELGKQIGTVDDMDGALNFVQVLLANAGLEAPLPPAHHAKGLTLSGTARDTIVSGPMTVVGDLSCDRNVVVFGDLDVQGHIDIWDYTTRFFVTGNVSCRGLSVSGCLWVGGDIDASAVFAGFRSRIGSQHLRARFVNEHSESYGIFAKVEADYFIKREEWRKSSAQAQARKEKILVPAAITDKSLDFEALMKLAGAGKPFLREDAGSAPGAKSETASKQTATKKTATKKTATKKTATKKTTTKAAGGSAVRLEFKSGTSNKFWEIRVQGPRYTVTFGPIGAAGQTQQKQLGSPAEAKLAAEKLMSSKLNKGYKRA